MLYSLCKPHIFLHIYCTSCIRCTWYVATPVHRRRTRWVTRWGIRVVPSGGGGSDGLSGPCPLPCAVYMHTTVSGTRYGLSHCFLRLRSDDFSGSILTRSVFQIFYSFFPKFRFFPIGKKQEIPKFRENTEKKTKKQPSLTSTLLRLALTTPGIRWCVLHIWVCAYRIPGMSNIYRALKCVPCSRVVVLLYRSGKGGEEPDMCPRIWVTSGTEREKKMCEDNEWDERKIYIYIYLYAKALLLFVFCFCRSCADSP